MSKDSINEMQQIQKSLEEFANQEVRKQNGSPSSAQGGQKKDVEVLWGTAAAARGKKPPAGDIDMIWGEDSPVEERHVRKSEPAQSGRTTASATREKPDRPADEPRYEKESRKSRKKQKRREKREMRGQESSYTKKGNVKNGTPPKKKKSKFKRFLFVLLILAVVLAGLWYYMVGQIYSKMVYKEAPELSAEPMKQEGVVNVLLIGSDTRTQGEDGRSDAMILLSISSRTKTIHMTSLLRDMYVEIPGYKGNRLNAAYSYGGPKLLLETVEQNLGIEVNRYVLVNFQAFASLVDAAGGVELELSNEEVQWVNAYLNEYNMLQGNPIDTDYLDTSLSGLLHLNGPQALAYSRNRYIGTDFGRTERQRKVLSAVIKKLPLTAVTNGRELVNGLFPNLTTNLTQKECLRLSLMAGKLITYDIIQDNIPIEGSFKNANIRGMAVLEVDFDKNREYLRQSLYGEAR